MAIDKRETEIRDMLRKLFERLAPRLMGRKVFLFGSRAIGDARPRSDFDIGVYGEAPLDIADFYEIDDMLDALPTLYSFDWVDMNRVDPEFRRRAMQNIEILYG
jgi:predicted nucleotidyltransferase